MAKRNLEYYKEKYLESLKHFESEEELRLAALHELKVNLLNMEHDDDYDNKVYQDALFRLIASDLRYMGMFLTLSNTIAFVTTNGTKKESSSVARLILDEKVVIYKEV